MTKNEQRKSEAVNGKGRGMNVKLSRLWADDHNRPQILLLLLALLLTVIIIPKGGLTPAHYAPGDIASRDVKAPRDMLVPDPDLTAKKRQEAEQAVLPIYDLDPGVGIDSAARLQQVLALLEPPTAEGPPAPAENLQVGVENLLGTALSVDEFRALQTLAAHPGFAAELEKLLRTTLSARIVGNLQLFRQDAERGVTVRRLVDQQEELLTDVTGVLGVGDALNRVEERLGRLEGVKKSQRKLLLGLISRMLRPTMTFNKTETEQRKLQAREAVKPVLFQVKKGEMIVREGARVTDDQILKLRALRALGSDHGTLRMAFGMLVTLLVLLQVAHGFSRQNISKFRMQPRDQLFQVTVFVGLFVLIKLSIFFANAIETAFPYIDSTSYYYFFPFAVGAMLVRIVRNSEVALVFTALSSVFLGVLFSNSLLIAMFALVSSLTGAHWVRHCKERTTLYRAGLRISLANMAAIFGLHLMAGHQLDAQLLYKLGFGFAGGIFCAVIVTAAIPLVESLFKYTTDIKLLELANLNTPVLRQLMVQAPGTYHHSIVVGNLAEAGAEAINANPLLARVAAYYHDIGKVRKPLYFVENQSGENKHDKLSPSMSSLILIAHVKDGVEICRENKLGDDLIAILREHHGTALMKFFYDKAKNLQDPDVQQVDERDYRYPGPKPQTREAALIMLADAVEAAGRTLADPTPARIQGMVQKIINNIFIDGQLDECELTLKDLHKIAKSFNRILAGIFHYRIDYPEPVHKEKEPAKKKNGDDPDREPAKEAKDRDGETKKGSAEDLKRLGMS